MATYQTIRLGRLTLREDFTAAEATEESNRRLSLTGRESMGIMGKRTRLEVEQRRDDLLSTIGEMVAVTFTEKKNLNGFYEVQSATANITNWDDQWVIMDWTAELVRVGVDTEIDIESRLSGAVTRTNSFNATGSRCHAPSINHKAYWAGGTPPVYIGRMGEEGELRLYRNLEDGINPRWGVEATDYELGRVRFIDHHNLERTGTSFTTRPDQWLLSNSLIRVRPGNGSTFRLDYWNNGLWSTKDWNLTYGGVVAGVADYVTVLDNSYASITVRLTYSLEPVGRMVVDLTLRRGFNFVEMYVHHEFAADLTFGLSTPEQGEEGNGYISSVATNQQPNPSFEDPGTWTSSGVTVTQTTAQTHSGTYSLEMTPDGTSSEGWVSLGRVDVQPGNSVQVGLWARFTTAAGRYFAVSMDWYDENGDYLQTTRGTSDPPSGTGVWLNYSHTFTVPPGAYQGAIVPTYSGTPAATDIWWVDDAYFAVPGLSYIVGSAQTFTGDVNAGTITKTNTAFLDAFFGVSVDARPGNAPSDLYAQYLGAPAEITRGVSR